MANAQNIKPAKSFQDDLDAIFDGLDLEDYSENLKDDSDDFDRLLTEKIAGQSTVKKELTDADVDKLLMVSDKSKIAPKLVALDKKADNSRKIDALLDNAISLDDNDHFEFKSFDIDENNVDFSNDGNAEPIDKSAEALKKVVFDQFDDFESFDEFGDIETANVAKAFDLIAAPKSNKAEKPESMVDLEGSLGIKFQPAIGKIEGASDDKAPMSAELSATSLTSQLKLDTPFAVEKIEPFTNALVKENQATKATFSAEKNRADAPALDYEILDDDFIEEQSHQLKVEHKEDGGGAQELMMENDGADFELFESPWDENSVSGSFEQIDDTTAGIAKTTDNHGSTVGFNEVDNLEDDYDDVADLSKRTAPTEIDVSPKAPDASSLSLENQISALWTAHKQVKKQMDEFTQNTDQGEHPDKLEELDRQSRERRERKQLQDLFENKSKKISRIAYTAAGASVLSLLIGGAALTLGIKSWSDVKALKMHTVEIDNDIAGIKAGRVAAVGGTAGRTNDNPSVVQLAEQVKKIQAVLAGDKSAIAHGLNTSAASPSAENTLQDIQFKGDKSIRIVATADNGAGSARSKASGGKALWVANLLSVRQNLYAQQKAADFAKQGIPTVLVPVEVNGQTIYILRSNGFSTQDQALEYATKAKKALNLPSILVSQDG